MVLLNGGEAKSHDLMLLTSLSSYVIFFFPLNSIGISIPTSPAVLSIEFCCLELEPEKSTLSLVPSWVCGSSRFLML